jgi:hypothetical protein
MTPDELTGPPTKSTMAMVQMPKNLHQPGTARRYGIVPSACSLAPAREVPGPRRRAGPRQVAG